jgi:hypothetical protein
MIYIHKEISLVLFVLMTLIAWGKNDIVVQVAAAKPINVDVSMSNILSAF